MVSATVFPAPMVLPHRLPLALVPVNSLRCARLRSRQGDAAPRIGARRSDVRHGTGWPRFWARRIGRPRSPGSGGPVAECRCSRAAVRQSVRRRAVVGGVESRLRLAIAPSVSQRVDQRAAMPRLATRPSPASTLRDRRVTRRGSGRRRIGADVRRFGRSAGRRSLCHSAVAHDAALPSVRTMRTRVLAVLAAEPQLGRGEQPVDDHVFARTR